MFLITAGLSFRTIENKYFKLLITEFFKVQFSWPGRIKIRKLVAKFVKEKKENIKKKLIDAKKHSITTYCLTAGQPGRRPSLEKSQYKKKPNQKIDYF